MRLNLKPDFKAPARWRLAAALALALSLAACVTRDEVRGYVPDEEALSAVKPGVHTREQVIEMLGSPSTVSTFTEHRDTWYYITRRTERFAFLDEKLVDQQVVAIAFDQSGRVSEITRLGTEDARDVNPVDRRTPTLGKELGFFEQLFGNIGRFPSQ